MTNLYIFFEIKSKLYQAGNGLALKNRLFGTVKLTKNGYLNKQSYSGYGVLVDIR